MTRDPSVDLATLHACTEGTAQAPLFCGPKLELLQWGEALEAAHVLCSGSEWTPCCRTFGANLGCILDQFADEEDDAVRAVILEAARRHDLDPPKTMIPRDLAP